MPRAVGSSGVIGQNLLMTGTTGQQGQQGTIISAARQERPVKADRRGQRGDGRIYFRPDRRIRLWGPTEAQVFGSPGQTRHRICRHNRKCGFSWNTSPTGVTGSTGANGPTRPVVRADRFNGATGTNGPTGSTGSVGATGIKDNKAPPTNGIGGTGVEAPVGRRDPQGVRVQLEITDRRGDASLVLGATGAYRGRWPNRRYRCTDQQGYGAKHGSHGR
jgi:hypothetical protein